VLLIDFPETSNLARDRTALPDDGRREPKPAAAAPIIEFAGAIRLDPRRTAFDLSLPQARRRAPWGPVGSLLLHLLPLLLIVDWPRAPTKVETAIPIQLVIEPPAPAPQKTEAKPAAKPPAGRRGSDDMAEAESTDVEMGGGNPTPKEDKPAAPAAATDPVPEAKTALVAPPLPPPAAPIPLDLPAIDTRPPLPEPQAAATPPTPPKAILPKRREAIPTVTLRDSSWPLPLHRGAPSRVQRTARLIGPPTVRDEYCAEALAMTLKHMDLLPRALTGARQGETQLAIQVLGDGTINSVRVVRSSGYADIDERIERMVVAVGRFPPLPRWMGASMDFVFNLHFPHPLQR
jgi:TonB family protein